MNYFNIDFLTKDEIDNIHSCIVKSINDYPEDSEFRQKLQEDLWDIEDVLGRNDEEDIS